MSAGCKVCELLGVAHPTSKIVFGVHPEIIAKLGKPTAVARQEFNVCEEHWNAVQSHLLGLITDISVKCSSSSDLEKGLGCWITFLRTVPILNSNPPVEISNFQVPYAEFEEIYKRFVRAMGNQRQWEAAAQSGYGYKLRWRGDIAPIAG